MRLLRKSLVARLLTFSLLLAMVPIAVIGYLAYDSGRQAIVDDVKDHLESVAILKEHDIQIWVESLEYSATWLAADPQTISDAAVMTTHAADTPQYSAARDSLNTELARIADLGNLSPIFLLDGDGKIVAASDDSWEGKYREDKDYFLHGSEDTYVSDIFHNLVLGRPTMVVSTPVRDSSGGVLAGHADLNQLSGLMLERSGLGQTGETYLVNKNNLLITESRFEPGLTFKKWIFTDGVSRALEGQSGADLYLDYQDIPVIGAYRWLEDREMALIAKQDQAEALAPVNDLRNTVLMLAGVVFAAAAVVSILLTRQITNPLRKLAEYARSVGKGEYSAEIEIKGEDEVASVATDVQTMVRQLQHTQERLLTAKRLATLGQFSGSISHELRNPLGVIDSSAYYLKSQLKDANDKVKEHLDCIRLSVKSATAIIQSLLNLTRMKEPRLTMLDLIAVTHDAIVTAKVPSKVKLEQSFPDQEVPIQGDSEQLRMAFKNIIRNATEAMDNQGTLTVNLDLSTAGWVEISFADTGPGIDRDNLKRIFQPLFSTKAKGIGFGLSITKMVIDKNGGKITAKSEKGKGATIIVKLPLYDTAKEKGEEA